MKKKAIVLFSGGLDSTTVVAIAKNSGFEIFALSFDYGQRHKIELEFARKNAEFLGVKDHKIAKIDLRIFGGSSLTDNIDVPAGNLGSDKIPITYVPARNTIFLSYALAFAEVVGAFDIFIGANAVDYSGYPDCRPEFIESFEGLANLATAASGRFNIHAPLIEMSKSGIIKKGLDLGVDYSRTYSCYNPTIKDDKVYSCRVCDSCCFRLKGFKDAGLEDKILYSI